MVPSHKRNPTTRPEDQQRGATPARASSPGVTAAVSRHEGEAAGEYAPASVVAERYADAAPTKRREAQRSPRSPALTGDPGLHRRALPVCGRSCTTEGMAACRVGMAVAHLIRRQPPRSTRAQASGAWRGCCEPEFERLGRRSCGDVGAERTSGPSWDARRPCYGGRAQRAARAIAAGRFRQVTKTATEVDHDLRTGAEARGRREHRPPHADATGRDREDDDGDAGDRECGGKGGGLRGRLRLADVHAVHGGVEAFEPTLSFVADALLVVKVLVTVGMHREDHEHRVGVVALSVVLIVAAIHRHTRRDEPDNPDGRRLDHQRGRGGVRDSQVKQINRTPGTSARGLGSVPGGVDSAFVLSGPLSIRTA